MPPSTEGGAGGIMFSGCPSVRPSRLTVITISQEPFKINLRLGRCLFITIGRRSEHFGVRRSKVTGHRGQLMKFLVLSLLARYLNHEI